MAIIVNPGFLPSSIRRHTTMRGGALSFKICSDRLNIKKTFSTKVSREERKKRFFVKAALYPKIEHILKKARKTSRFGKPSWTTPEECGNPPKNAPSFCIFQHHAPSVKGQPKTKTVSPKSFIYPGIDGTGLGMALQYKTLGELFEVRCLCFPMMDRTKFEDLLNFVERTLKLEHGKNPLRPIYLVGDCFGGCLSLAVAANNPDIDLTLILVNPGTCYSKSPIRFWLSLMTTLTGEFYTAFPFMQGESMVLANLLPKEILLWRLKMLQSAEVYANSRLASIRHHVLLLASGKDDILPSRDEALRLKKLLKNSKTRYFKNSLHSLLLEEDVYLSTIIKGVGFYRKSSSHDFINDFVPPTVEEIDRIYQQNTIIRKLTSPVFFSTNQSGKIMKGLSGIPQKGPVLFVGIHMLMGLEISALASEMLNECGILLRGLAHPILFDDFLENDLQEPGFYDAVRLFGAVPSTARNLYHLLSSNSFVLLYPGGAREALHQRGEQYKLFWPEKPEFIRMAAQFEATIVPFGIVGEDEILEVLLNYEDVLKIPFYNNTIKRLNKRVRNLRKDSVGEVANQPMYLPIMLPKPPGRLYVLFGKPISTVGRKVELRDKSSAKSLYLEVKREVEKAMEYLIVKREQDPFKSFLPRFIYEAASGFTSQMPTFSP